MPGSTYDHHVDGSAQDQARTRLTKPLEYTGLLDSYKNSDLTPVIGREYHGLQINNLLALPMESGDAVIRDLAVTSQTRSFFLPVVLGS